jgi:Protein of unknown function (DUF742)
VGPKRSVAPVQLALFTKGFAMTLPSVPEGESSASGEGHPNRLSSQNQYDDQSQANSESRLGGERAEDFDESPLVRSFLGRSLRTTAETDFDDRSFRPFMVTGGRTTSDFPLDFEAMVTPTPVGLCADLRFEQRTIVDRCMQSGAQSIAELAAYLKLPIGTVRVVAADLVSSHMLDVHSPDKNLSNDVLMLKRLINGVRAL